MIIDAVVSCVFTIAIGMALIVTLRELYVKGVDLSTMTTEKKGKTNRNVPDGAEYETEKQG